MQIQFQERPALGSLVRMALVADDREDLGDLFRELWLELLRFEQRCSRFLPDSELTGLNRAAGSRLHITPEFQDVLEAAARMAAVSDGLFNPFVLPALQRNGYMYSLVPGRAQQGQYDYSDRAVVPSERLEIGPGWASIPYGTAIDLGGCGKGYIGDRLAAMVQSKVAVKGYWLSIGGDTVAEGCDNHGMPWVVELYPRPDGPLLGDVKVPRVGKYAIATSTTYLRSGIAHGSAWHHIIDPRTGRPAETNMDVAVVCRESLLLADVLASCVIIAGSDELPGYLSKHKVKDAAWILSYNEQPQSFGERIRVDDTWTAHTRASKISD